MFRSMFSPRIVAALKSRSCNAARTFSAESPAPVQLPIALYGEQATYANALYKTAVRSNSLDKVQDDLNKFDDLVKNNAPLQTYLSNPIISKKDKATDMGIISKKLGLSTITSGFLGVVAENGRLQEVGTIISKFGELMKAKNKVVEAKVTTAKKLSKKDLAALKKSIESGFLKPGERLAITFVEDTSIIGGLQLEIGDRFLDLSVQSQISKLGSALGQSK